MLAKDGCWAIKICFGQIECASTLNHRSCPRLSKKNDVKYIAKTKNW